jgi:hypothetical protein
MLWQVPFRNRLIQHQPLTAQVENRIYWMDRPQGTPLPAVTLQVVSEGREQHMKGFSSLSSVRLQADIWAAVYSQARTIAEEVIAATVPSTTQDGVFFERAFVAGLRDMGERVETKYIHRVSVDFIIHHSTTA